MANKDSLTYKEFFVDGSDLKRVELKLLNGIRVIYTPVTDTEVDITWTEWLPEDGGPTAQQCRDGLRQFYGGAWHEVKAWDNHGRCGVKFEKSVIHWYEWPLAVGFSGFMIAFHVVTGAYYWLDEKLRKDGI